MYFQCGKFDKVLTKKALSKYNKSFQKIVRSSYSYFLIVMYNKLISFYISAGNIAVMITTKLIGFFVIRFLLSLWYPQLFSIMNWN